MRILTLVVISFVAAAVNAQTRRLYGPYFVSDASHSSTLLLHNKRGDRPVTAAVYVTRGAERLLLRRVSPGYCD